MMGKKMERDRECHEMRWRYVDRPDTSGAVERTMRATGEEQVEGRETEGRVRRGGRGENPPGGGLDFPAGNHPREKSSALYRRVSLGNEARGSFHTEGERGEKQEGTITRCFCRSGFRS